jgi:hypothetical protein
VTSAFKLGDGDSESLGAFGESRITALCRALGLEERQALEARALFRSISGSWAGYPLGGRAPFRNDITDDGTPFEFSVGFEREKPELRVLFESQLPSGKPSTRSSWEAGINLQRQLQQQGALDTTRFDRIAASFAPGLHPALPRFALWHAVVMRAGSSPLFKAYVNPEVAGAEQAPSRLGEALSELAMPSALRFVQERLSRETRIPYLSLDLEASAQARVKIYLSATHTDEVDRLLSGAVNATPGQAQHWLRTLTGFDGEYTDRPILVCFSFRGDDPAPSATVHVPVRSYVSCDEEALQRTVPLLPQASAAQLKSAMSCFAAGSLLETRGILSYVSLRPVGEHVRVTTYLAPLAYSVSSHDPRTIPATIPGG